MGKNYYSEIVQYIAKNEMLIDMLDEVLYKIANEIQIEISKNILTFHHSALNGIEITKEYGKIFFKICNLTYTIDEQQMLKKYISTLPSTNDLLEQDSLKDCLLNELLKVVKNYYK